MRREVACDAQNIVCVLLFRSPQPLLWVEVLEDILARVSLVTVGVDAPPCFNRHGQVWLTLLCRCPMCVLYDLLNTNPVYDWCDYHSILPGLRVGAGRVGGLFFCLDSRLGFESYVLVTKLH